MNRANDANRFEQATSLLEQALIPLVEAALKKEYGENWKVAASAPVQADRVAWDVASLLKTIRGEPQLFPKNLEDQVKPLERLWAKRARLSLLEEREFGEHARALLAQVSPGLEGQLLIEPVPGKQTPDDEEELGIEEDWPEPYAADEAQPMPPSSLVDEDEALVAGEEAAVLEEQEAAGIAEEPVFEEAAPAPGAPVSEAAPLHTDSPLPGDGEAAGSTEHSSNAPPPVVEDASSAAPKEPASSETHAPPARSPRRSPASVARLAVGILLLLLVALAVVVGGFYVYDQYIRPSLGPDSIASSLPRPNTPPVRAQQPTPAVPTTPEQNGTGAPAAEEELVLIGYVQPKLVGEMSVAGAWSSTQGWLRPPEGWGQTTPPRIPPRWRATSWKLFAIGYDKPVTVETKPELVPSYRNFDARSPLVTPAPDGVAVAGPGIPLTRPCIELNADRAGLVDDTRRLLNPRVATDVTIDSSSIKEAYRVDLDDDGTEEVLWAARSREDWKTEEDTRPEDYTLLGLRYMSGRIAEQIAVDVETGTKLNVPANRGARYRILCPLDIDGDRRLEIFALATYNSGYTILFVFTFDGEKVKRVL